MSRGKRAPHLVPHRVLTKYLPLEQLAASLRAPPPAPARGRTDTIHTDTEALENEQAPSIPLDADKRSSFISGFSKDDSHHQWANQQPASTRESQEYASSKGSQQHARNLTESTSLTTPSGEYGDIQHQKQHDYEVQTMESDFSSRVHYLPRNPIPAPTMTIRSEFPTLSRCRQRQPLTCLVTVEVPEDSWQLDIDDVLPPSTTDSHFHEDLYPPPPARQSPSIMEFQLVQRESQEKLDEVTRHLRAGLERWHGVDVKWYAFFFFFFVVYIYNR